MKVESLYDLFQNLHNDKLSFIYQGSFNDEITDRIIDISETNILNQQDETKISNKVSFLLAECFQNIIRHGENSAAKAKSTEAAGIFITRNIGKSYYISSANIVENKDVDGLKEKIEEINKLSQEELKRLYIDVLANREFSKKGGAGLGLIEMARKSGQKLEFEFEPVDDEFSYFYLQIKLKSPDETALRGESVNIAKDFHRIMAENNIFIIHKGDFSQHTTVPILRMIEENLQTSVEYVSLKKKIYHALVEILQNVSKHALETNGKREGIFLIGNKNNKFIIYTGNFISNQKVPALKNHLETLISLNKEELQQLFKYTLHLGTTTTKGGAGLGLIDLFRSTEKLTYQFTQVDETTSFYALHVII
jgi:anti-sigma regulatory factor (Ser/Thr protein kinase)